MSIEGDLPKVEVSAILTSVSTAEPSMGWSHRQLSQMMLSPW